MRFRKSAVGLSLVLGAAGAASCSSDDPGTNPEETGGAGGNLATGSTPGSGGISAGTGAGTGSGGKSGGGNSGLGGNGGATFSGGAGGGLSTGGADDGPDSSVGGSGAGGTSACQTTTQSYNDASTGSALGQFAFQGDWAVSTAPEKFQDDDHYASVTGATATIRFNGTHVAIHSAKADHHGIAEVRVDGGAATDVDLYATDRADDEEVWSSATLSAGEHTLAVRVSGRKNAASTGTVVAVDRVVVESSMCTTGTGGAANTGGASATGGTSATGGKSSTGGASATGGKSSTGGTSATGGASSTGGKSGTGGTTGGGTVSRPGYNTGKGFFVVGSKLYDPNGVEFRIRGVNKLHWDASSPGIPKTHSNTERWNIDFTRAAASNATLMQQTIDNHIVPMPGNWKGTCDESAATLTGIVDTWVSQASTWKTLDRYMILNIANEWGPSGAVWRDSYITAIGRLRAAGYLSTISVTAGGCGQSNEALVNYAKAVFDSDPQKNVIFDQHIYGNWSNGGGQSWQTDLKTALDKLGGIGVPFIIGEFGPGRSIGPSPTTITPEAIMQAAESHGFGWLAWAWDDPANNADDTWFALSKNGDYNSSNDLTMFGKSVVENATYGLLVLAKPATVF